LRALLIVLGGLPGAGKTTIARELARTLGAVHVRIDSIEQAIRTSGIGAAPLDDAGYRVGYAVAGDNLRLGRSVIADSVNPIPLTRDAWLAVATAAGVPAIEVEIVCSDPVDHRRRVEERDIDVPGLAPPSWQAVRDRDYRPWERAHLVVDTALRRPADCVAEIVNYLAAAGVKNVRA
jgi:predicted kinase